MGKKRTAAPAVTSAAKKSKKPAAASSDGPNAFEKVWNTKLSVPPFDEGDEAIIVGGDSDDDAGHFMDDGTGDTDGDSDENASDDEEQSEIADNEYEDKDEEGSDAENDGTSKDQLREADLEARIAELEQEKFPLRESLRLFRSLLRCLLVTSRSQRGTRYKAKGATPRFKDRAESFQANQSRLRRLKETSPYQIHPEVQRVASFCSRLLVLINASPKQVEEQSGSGRVGSYFRAFWKDVTIFIEHRGARDDLSRSIICEMQPSLVGTLSFYPLIVFPWFKRVVDMWLRAIEQQEAIGRQVSHLIEVLSVLAYKKSGKTRVVYTNLLEQVCKRIFSCLSLTCRKKMGSKTVAHLWEIASVVESSLKGLMLHHASIIHHLGFSVLRGLTILTSQYLRIDKAGSKKVNKDMEADLRARVYGWATLISAKIFIGLMNTPPGVHPRYALSRLSEGWAILLITLIKRASTSMAYSPFVIKALTLLNAMMRNTDKFLPLGSSMLQLAYRFAEAENNPVKNGASRHLAKCVDVNTVIVLDKDQLASIKVVEDLFMLSVSLIGEYLSLLALHPSFPESNVIINTHLKKLIKITKSSVARAHLKQLSSSVEKTARKVEADRMTMVMADTPTRLNALPSKRTKCYEVVTEG